MKLEKAIYEAPTMSQDNLLELINAHLPMLRTDTKQRVSELHKNNTLIEAISKEFDLVQAKKSNLTKSQRDEITGFVGMCIIQMTHGKSK